MLHPFANRYRAVPTYLNPYMYKMDSEGEILLDRGDEYYDDSIPYDGVYIHFAKQIMEVSSRRIELYAGIGNRNIVTDFYLTVYLLLNRCTYVSKTDIQGRHTKYELYASIESIWDCTSSE